MTKVAVVLVFGVVACAVLAAFVPFLTLYAILLHANVGWTFGPLRDVIASPVFHRWHHTSEDEGFDTTVCRRASVSCTTTCRPA
jgi:sterol desaturase/sphingolipid hydroxylase (fatty acid hydroxylase superfamily)